MHDVVDAKDCSNVVHSKWKHRLHQGCFLSRDEEEVSRRLMLGGEAGGGLAEVDVVRQEVNTARMARCFFTVFRRRRRGSTFSQQLHTKSHHQCHALRVQHKPPPLKKNTHCQKLPRKTKTCSSSLVSLMTPAQSLPSQPSPYQLQPILDGRKRRCCNRHIAL